MLENLCHRIRQPVPGNGRSYSICLSLTSSQVRHLLCHAWACNCYSSALTSTWTEAGECSQVRSCWQFPLRCESICWLSSNFGRLRDSLPHPLSLSSRIRVKAILLTVWGQQQITFAVLRVHSEKIKKVLPSGHLFISWSSLDEISFTCVSALPTQCLSVKS